MRIQFKQTGTPTLVKHTDGGVTVAIPITVKRYSGRREVVLPHGVSTATLPEPQEPTIVQAALARGHIWQRMLDDGRVKSIGQISRKEGVDDRYVARFLNLTTLAPEIVAAILDETLPEDVTLADLSLNPAAVWEEQRKAMGVGGWGRRSPSTSSSSTA
jgi:hypothetical protein